MSIMALLFLLGCYVTFQNNLRNNSSWVGHNYTDSSVVLATISEPLVTKAKSYKALVQVTAVRDSNRWIPVKGNILLYFKKDSLVKPALQYGWQIIFSKPLQPIVNPGNPGSFNYQRYSAFHNIHFQSFLKATEYRVVGINGGTAFNRWLFTLRAAVLGIIRTNIADPKQQGVAEALLIGYRDDLDKNLVQAYSNTGVVHIIAISGLHLGMIYGTLILLFGLVKKRPGIQWIKFVVVLSVLWLFSLLAGAAPSILRSAIMFTFLLVGEMMRRKVSIYNTLAASAFTILCVNPFALWDVGFQLSYAAVLSIVLFMKPINNWFYLQNKLLSGVWNLTSVTLSAQVLTIPIVCYHFHQFPNLFLLTNFVVVPLSSLILYCELALVIVGSLYPPLALLIGKITGGLLWCMNTFIEKVNALPFSVWEGIQISVLQTVVMFGAIIGFSWWLMLNKKAGVYIGLAFTLLFVGLRSADFYKTTHREQMIVYNIPQYTAIDFIHGRSYQFAGDSSLFTNDFLQNFHLKPGRVLKRLQPNPINHLALATPFYFFNTKKVLVVNRPFKFTQTTKTPVDVIILAKNARVHIYQLANSFNCPVFVIDGSNSVWKMNQWKKECDSLHLRHYSTQESGAFVMDL